MARVEVVMPQMGESIAEGTIVKWHKKPGEQVSKDETLLEITTDKVDSDIPAPASGTLSEVMAEENATVAVRTPIAIIDTEGMQSAATEKSAPKPASASASGENSTPEPLQAALPQQSQQQQTPQPQPPTQQPSPLQQQSPPTQIEQQPPPTSDRTQPPPASSTAQTSAATAELLKKYPSPLYDVVPMTSVMQKMAAHMVRSVSTSPHVAAHHEVDMTPIVQHRTQNMASFEAKEGFKLTYTPYIVEAVIKAIQTYPLVNSSVEGTTIIKKNFINLGIAVASETGLIVPVIKHAEEKNFLGLARAVNELVARVRARKLAPDDVQGGTFTITNYGIFGTMIGTPIINQPQVAILGTGAIRPRVSVVNETIAIRSIAYFTLSFDHRIIDGELGGRFLEAVIGHLQTFDTTLKF
ncbi:MAG TPA: dihydrolipoamide acetyltransferase family protein [Bacteroidota bacterium]|nr:dihydrolipoamide acetyltransferase family protein [Bacteroidota bacterium]